MKYPRSVFLLTSCNVQLFLKIFERYQSLQGPSPDFKKVYMYLFQTMQGIFLYAKQGGHDLLFQT